jgi:hypothetical protein
VNSWKESRPTWLNFFSPRGKKNYRRPTLGMGGSHARFGMGKLSSKPPNLAF